MFKDKFEGNVMGEDPIETHMRRQREREAEIDRGAMDMMESNGGPPADWTPPEAPHPFDYGDVVYGHADGRPCAKEGCGLGDRHPIHIAPPLQGSAMTPDFSEPDLEQDFWLHVTLCVRGFGRQKQQEEKVAFMVKELRTRMHATDEDVSVLKVTVVDGRG